MALLAPARRTVLTFFLVMPLFFLSAMALGPEPFAPEYRIEAAFLFNFAQFVEWPPQAFAGADTPLVIGILGSDPFGGALDDTVRNEKTRGRPLVVRRYSRVEDAASSHILFIPRSEQRRFAADLAALKGRNVLTVSDAVEFLRDGGIIRFVTENSRIRLRINLAAAKAAGLTISSKLLRPSEIFVAGGN